MASVFTRIIAGELPGRFVWRDPEVVAFLTANPLKPGHTLVVPRREVDHWLDLDPELTAKLFAVAQTIGRGIAQAFPCRKVGVIVAGLEVPHVHIHLVPIRDLHDLDLDRQDKNPDPDALDEAAARLRAALADLGHPEAAA